MITVSITNRHGDSQRESRVGRGRSEQMENKWGQRETGLWVVNAQCSMQMMFCWAVHLRSVWFS